ncbi:uncharacterized protein LOC108707523 isoform X2 [Xenopus laevis]|uniref:Uncharacterized protein LOC108707523 isoform X2 n=1 Tax=Xenopus laevis TaxID=8355 RepID=A0A8J1M957_XENLA|nr:uncharacterized protein LOC108707523 isoform X2 [Xenopus laevis]
MHVRLLFQWWTRSRMLMRKMTTQMKDKEAFQRQQILYQAAHCVLAQNPDNVELARFYCHNDRMISKRLVLRQKMTTQIKDKEAFQRQQILYQKNDNSNERQRSFSETTNSIPENEKILTYIGKMFSLWSILYVGLQLPGR